MQDLLEDYEGSDSSDGTGRKQDTRYHSPNIRVTGLRDGSNCIFGDPLLATVFSRDRPSREFLRGFSGRPFSLRPRRMDHDPTDEDSSYNFAMRINRDVYGDTIEAPEEAHIRLLLHQCYHAAVAVVKEFYRPHNDSTSRELAARKRLNIVLARLAEIGDDPKRGHVRPSGETSLAKKSRTQKDRNAALAQDMDME